MKLASHCSVDRIRGTVLQTRSDCGNIFFNVLTSSSSSVVHPTQYTHINIPTLCVCQCMCPRLAGRMASLKTAFCPNAVNQSPTVGTNTGMERPPTGITMLQNRRKMAVIFNALLSGLKGTGTWRNCAAKCVFLCKAH